MRGHWPRPLVLTLYGILVGGLQREVDSKSAKDTVLKNSFSPTQSTISGIILPTSHNCWLWIYIIRKKKKKRKVKSKGNLAQQMVKSMLQRCLISSCFLSSSFFFFLQFCTNSHVIVCWRQFPWNCARKLCCDEISSSRTNPVKQTQTGNLPGQVRASSISVWENTLPVAH